MTVPLIQLRDVSKVFGGGLFNRQNRTVAVEKLSLTLNEDPPSVTALVGESGSGKSTLAHLLLGLVNPTTGQVLYNGEELRRMGRRERKTFRRDVQVIFQDPFEVYNPFYKIDHPLFLPVRKFRLARSRSEARALVEETLRNVGLRPEETLGRYPHQLSGGQRQRVMVARALLMKPRLIVADEPVSMIDASLRATVLQTLLSLNQDFGISIVYITHDLTTAYQISENIIVLYQGSVAEVGDVDRVVRAPQHPYTQRLVGAIPMADPDRPWAGQRSRNGVAPFPVAEEVHTTGCKYVPRCPYAMDVCVETPPPLFRSEEHRAASCYLQEDASMLEDSNLSSIFVPPRGQVGTSATR